MNEFVNYLELVSINAKTRVAELRHSEIIARLVANPFRKMLWRYQSFKARFVRHFPLGGASSSGVVVNKIASKSCQVDGVPVGLFSRISLDCTEISMQLKDGFSPHCEDVIQTGNDCVIFIHAYYSESAEEIFSLVSNIKDVDVVITTPKRNIVKLAEYWFKNSENVRVLLVDNHGRDVLPFLLAISVICLRKYSSFAKIHTKKSLHLASGVEWYHKSVYSILGSPSFFSFLRTAIFKGYPCLIGREMLPIQDHLDQNRFHLLRLIPNFHESLPAFFIPGTMFFGNVEFLHSIRSKDLFEMKFENEEGQLDGTFAHALERYFGFVCSNEGGRVLTFHRLLADF